VHGFASSQERELGVPGLGFGAEEKRPRVIALDNRGHGDSPNYDAGQYHIGTMAGDVTALMDHLEIARADIMAIRWDRDDGWLAQSQPAAGCVRLCSAASGSADRGGGPRKRRRSAGGSFVG